MLAHYAILGPARLNAAELDYAQAWAAQRAAASGGGLPSQQAPTRTPTFPDFSTVSWELENGVVCTLTTAQTPAAPSIGADFEIHSTKASLLIDRTAGHVHLAHTKARSPRPRDTTEILWTANPPS